jgi:exoribonuclease II
MHVYYLYYQTSVDESVENVNLINIFLKFVVQSIEFKTDSLGILTDHSNLVLGI